MTRDHEGRPRHSVPGSGTGIRCSGDHGGPGRAERSSSGVTVDGFPRVCLREVFVLAVKGRGRAFLRRRVVPSLKGVVARLVEATGFERCPDSVSAGEIGDVRPLVEGEEIEVFYAF